MSRSISATLAMAFLLPLGVSAQAHPHDGDGAHPMMQHMMQMQGSQAGLSVLLLGNATDLGLTDAQTSSLQAILSKARSDALEALTPEQRQKLETSPAMPSACPLARPTTGTGS